MGIGSPAKAQTCTARLGSRAGFIHGFPRKSGSHMCEGGRRKGVEATQLHLRGSRRGTPLSTLTVMMAFLGPIVPRQLLRELIYVWCRYPVCCSHASFRPPHLRTPTNNPFLITSPCAASTPPPFARLPCPSPHNSTTRGTVFTLSYTRSEHHIVDAPMCHFLLSIKHSSYLRVQRCTWLCTWLRPYLWRHLV